MLSILNTNNMENIEFEDIKSTPKKGGFFPLPIIKKCNHPDHEPPSMICIPKGHGYQHVCPGCGSETVITPLQTNL